jgi:hypothetical protein
MADYVIALDGTPLTNFVIAGDGLQLSNPVPNRTQVAIDGADGLLDLTAHLTFGNRTAKFDGWFTPGEGPGVGSLFSAAQWAATWHGKKVMLTVPDITGSHLEGVATFDWTAPDDINNITPGTLTVDCFPFWLADTDQSVTVQATTGGAPFTIQPTGFRIIPVLTVTGNQVTIRTGGTPATITLPPGQWPCPDLAVDPGDPPRTGAVVGSGSTVTLTWRTGHL